LYKKEEDRPMLVPIGPDHAAFHSAEERNERTKKPMYKLVRAGRMESIVIVSFPLSDNSAIQLTPSGKDRMVEGGTQLRALLLRYDRKRDLVI